MKIWVRSKGVKLWKDCFKYEVCLLRIFNLERSYLFFSFLNKSIKFLSCRSVRCLSTALRFFGSCRSIRGCWLGFFVGWLWKVWEIGYLSSCSLRLTSTGLLEFRAFWLNGLDIIKSTSSDAYWLHGSVLQDRFGVENFLICLQELLVVSSLNSPV